MNESGHEVAAATMVDPVLRSCAVFAALDARALVRLSASTGRHSYDEGQIVFQQGDEGDCMYVVASGSVEISVQDPEGGVAVLARIAAPTAFGELAVIDGGPRVAMATAHEPTELVRIPRATVLALLATEPSVSGALVSSLVGLVRRVDEQVSDLALRRLPQRVRRHLLSEVVRQTGTTTPGPDGVLVVDMRINQSDIARQVGGSRQHVNRILAALDGAGAIERRGQRIVAVRPQLLAFDE
jgi:CRP/FNR family cyclic AMP-dependent transcriptional regulator